MGANNILGKVSKKEIEKNRMDRDERNNPADMNPGLDEEDDDGLGDIFGGGSSTEESSGDPFGSAFGGGDLSGGGFGSGDSFGGGFGGGFGGFGGGGLGGMGGLGGQEAKKKDSEEKVIEALGEGAKGFWGFSKNFASSFKHTDANFWAKWGSRTTLVGGTVAIIGVPLRVFLGWTAGFDVFIGGLFSVAFGVPVLMFSMDKKSDVPDSGVGDFGGNPFGDGADNPFGDTESNNPFGTNEEFGYMGDDEEEIVDDEEEDEDYEDVDDEPSMSDFDDDSALFDNVGDTGSTEKLSKEEALDSLPEMDKGVYTRQFLYDALIKYIPHVTPDFSDMKVIDEDSEVFNAFEAVLREASIISGVKEDNLPELLKLEESFFTLRLTSTRPTGLKADLLAEEISRIYSYDDGSFNPAVYATADTVGTKCIITVFTGENKMVTLKDIMVKNKDYILDTDNLMPVFLGVNQSGKVLKQDFKVIESLIVAGMPRSGKSWSVQSIMTQMCTFASPRELNFYICDPKEGISDFKSFTLPHVKKFVSKDEAIVNTLKNVIRVEGARRSRILGDAGTVNIWDFKKKHPDIRMPVIYVVIDEVVSLASRMDKETKQEFQKLITELITRLPAVGIRIFLIPHVVKNDIVAKTASDTVKCRVSVGGDPGHIESSTGTKPRNFKYKLTKKGDMAVNMPEMSPDTQYCRGLALTKSNEENAELFDYLRKVWYRLEPDEFKDSVAQGAMDKETTEGLVEEYDAKSEDDLLEDSLFEDSDTDLSRLDKSKVNNVDDDFDDLLE